MNQKYIALFLSLLIVSLSAPPWYFQDSKVYAEEAEEVDVQDSVVITLGTVLDATQSTSGTNPSSSTDASSTDPPCVIASNDIDLNLPANQERINSILYGGQETNSFSCTRSGRIHGAIDLAPRLPTGASFIRAPEAGTVFVNSNCGELVECVELRTASGIWKFGHLYNVNNPPSGIIRNGQQAQQCEGIGLIYIGNARQGESSSGPHVHVEYKNNAGALIFITGKTKAK